MNLFFRILLALHLCALVLMAGTTVIDYVSFKIFCSMTNAETGNASGMLPLMGRYGGLVRTGAVALILTGVIMLAINSSLWDELWFKVKLALALLLVLNGIFIGNNLGMKFRRMAAGNILSEDGRTVCAYLNWFYLVQLSLFALVIFVSIIRPEKTITR